MTETRKRATKARKTTGHATFGFSVADDIKVTETDTNTTFADVCVGQRPDGTYVYERPNFKITNTGGVFVPTRDVEPDGFVKVMSVDETLTRTTK